MRPSAHAAGFQPCAPAAPPLLSVRLYEFWHRNGERYRSLYCDLFGRNGLRGITIPQLP